MRVVETMTPDVRMSNPNQPISAAAKIAAEAGCGALPISEYDRRVGTISDPGIAVLTVAAGKGLYRAVREAMSQRVCCWFKDRDIDEAAANMGDIRVTRWREGDHRDHCTACDDDWEGRHE